MQQSFVVGVLSVFAKVSVSPNAGGLPGTDQAEKVISGLMFWAGGSRGFLREGGERPLAPFPRDGPRRGRRDHRPPNHRRPTGALGCGGGANGGQVLLSRASTSGAGSESASRCPS